MQNTLEIQSNAKCKHKLLRFTLRFAFAEHLLKVSFVEIYHNHRRKTRLYLLPLTSKNKAGIFVGMSFVVCQWKENEVLKSAGAHCL